MARNLDVDYPLGDPTSTTCRHCSDFKRAHRGGLLCDTCDGMAHLVNPLP